MPIRYNGQHREVEMALRIFTREVLRTARAQAPSALRWEHFRAWAQSPPGRKQYSAISEAATREIAAATKWWQANYLEPSVVVELRRRRFRAVLRAPRSCAAALGAAGAPIQAAPATPCAEHWPAPGALAEPGAIELSSDGEVLESSGATPRSRRSCISAIPAEQECGSAREAPATAQRGPSSDQQEGRAGQQRAPCRAAPCSVGV